MTTAALQVAGADDRLDVERARDVLAKARGVDEVKEMRDQAKAIALYQRTRKASVEAQQDAAEIELRAERRLGELTRDMPKRTGGHAAKARSHDATELDSVPRSLADQGIDKREAHRWQKVADVPEATFDEYIATARTEGKRITIAGALRSAAPEDTGDTTPAGNDASPEPDDDQVTDAHNDAAKAYDLQVRKLFETQSREFPKGERTLLGFAVAKRLKVFTKELDP